MTRTIYKTTYTVLKLEEQFETVRGYLDSEGKAQRDTRSIGWFVRVGPTLSFGVGPEKPDLKEGDQLELTLEKKRDGSADQQVPT